MILILRYFDFDFARLTTKEARPFFDSVRALLGITSEDDSGPPEALLSSLHSELVFNDLRDACRRHSKKERQGPAAFHSVAMKSCAKRSSGCKTVDVSDEAWSTPIKRKEIQSSVLSASRISDRTLGIPTSGLTKCRAPLLTKPHVLGQRLCLLKCLQQRFAETKGSLEDKRDASLAAYHSLWISKLASEHALIRAKSDNEQHVCHPELVLRSGPFNVLTLALTPASADHYETFSLTTTTEERIIDSLETFELAVAEPMVDEQSGKLCYQAKGEYLSFLKFTAQHSILQVPAGVLRSLMAKMKVKKSGNLTHKLRVELFLKTMECAQDYIDSVLAMIPDKPPRKRKAREEGGEEEEEDPEDHSRSFYVVLYVRYGVFSHKVFYAPLPMLFSCPCLFFGSCCSFSSSVK